MRNRFGSLSALSSVIGAVLLTGCSSSDTATPQQPAESRPNLVATLAPLPPLKAQPADDTLTSCEAVLDREVISDIVGKFVKLSAASDTTRSDVEFRETCSYTATGVSGHQETVARISVSQLNEHGLRIHRDYCAKGKLTSERLTGERLSKHLVPTATDGCIFWPNGKELRFEADPALPGFTARIGDQMVTASIRDFDTLNEKDATRTIRKAVSTLPSP